MHRVRSYQIKLATFHSSLVFLTIVAERFMLSGPELEFMQVHSRNLTVVQGPEAHNSAAPSASVARKPGYSVGPCVLHATCMLQMLLRGFLPQLA